LDNELALNELNNVSLPLLHDNLQKNEQSLIELDTVTLPLLDGRLKTAEQNFLDAQKRIDDAMADIRDVEDLLHDWQWEDTIEIDGGKIRANTVQALAIVAGSITTTQIRARSIVGNDLAVNTITTREISAQSITANEIASNAIITRHIATDAVTANEIAALTITATEISSDAIITRHISTNAVTANEIAARTITAAEIASLTIVSTNIASEAITTGKLAANSVNAFKISANAVTTEKIAANAVTANEIAARTITADEIAVNAITAGQIATDAIVSRHISFGAIVGDKIMARSITTNHLVAGAITADKIFAGSVRAVAIAAGAVTADKIAANAITAEHIQVGFNAMGNTMNLSPTALTFAGGGALFMRLTGTALSFHHTNGSEVGAFSRGISGTRPVVALRMRAGSDLIFGRVNNSGIGFPSMTFNGNTGNILVNNEIDMVNNILRNARLVNSSDHRLKENIEDTSVSGIKETKRIRMVDFNWKQDYLPAHKNQQPPKERQFGMIAQEAPFLIAQESEPLDHFLKIDLNKQINLNTKTNQFKHQNQSRVDCDR
uniref:tail fiber domain-containing protein n=1 Tax=Enterococcus casseliflavus TaxID=37734 RepID=UPI0022E5AA96